MQMTKKAEYNCKQMGKDLLNDQKKNKDVDDE